MSTETETTDVEPVVLPQSPLGLSIAVAIRQLALLVGGFVGVVTFLSKGDTAGLVDWLQTNDGITWATLAATGAAIAWGQIKTFRLYDKVAALIRNPRVPADVARFK